MEHGDRRTSVGSAAGSSKKPGKYVAPVPFYVLPMEPGLNLGQTEIEQDSEIIVLKPKKSNLKVKLINEKEEANDKDKGKVTTVMKTNSKIKTFSGILGGIPSRSFFPPQKTAFGLDPLEDVSAVFLKKTNELPFHTEMRLNKRFVIYNPEAKPIFFAGEIIDCGSYCWRGMQRRYCMYIFSIHGELLYTIERQRLQCCSRRPPTQEAVAANIYEISELHLANTRVHLSNGEFIGQIRDSSTSCTPRFNIDDENYTNVFKILGKCPGNWCPLLSWNTSQFQYFDRQHNSVGYFYRSIILESKITKKKTRCFGADFPVELDPITKALIIGAVFDLKITYFRRKFSMDMVVYILTIIWILALFVVSILLLLWATQTVVF